MTLDEREGGREEEIDHLVYARMMAAKAARPAMAMELPSELAAPLNGVMGELLAPGGETLPDGGALVPDAVGAGAPVPTGTDTEAGDPGGTGTLEPAGD